MNDFTCIEAEVTFISKEQGGRETMPLLSGGVYRPHIVIGDVNQRKAILIGNEIQETYLGVAFLSSPKDVELNKSFSAELFLMYYPHPSYDAIIPNATFTIREGATIVGFGKVLRLFNCELPKNT